MDQLLEALRDIRDVRNLDRYTCPGCGHTADMHADTEAAKREWCNEIGGLCMKRDVTVIAEAALASAEMPHGT